MPGDFGEFTVNIGLGINFLAGGTFYFNSNDTLSYYKYYFRKFFSMKLITGSDFNNAGISCKENLDL